MNNDAIISAEAALNHRKKRKNTRRRVVKKIPKRTKRDHENINQMIQIVIINVEKWKRKENMMFPVIRSLLAVVTEVPETVIAMLVLRRIRLTFLSLYF